MAERPTDRSEVPRDEGECPDGRHTKSDGHDDASARRAPCSEKRTHDGKPRPDRAFHDHRNGLRTKDPLHRGKQARPARHGRSRDRACGQLRIPTASAATSPATQAQEWPDRPSPRRRRDLAPRPCGHSERRHRVKEEDPPACKHLSKRQREDHQRAKRNEDEKEDDKAATVMATHKLRHAFHCALLQATRSSSSASERISVAGTPGPC